MCVLVLDKNRVLAEAQAEMKSLRLSDRLKQKAVDEVHSQLDVSLPSVCLIERLPLLRFPGTTFDKDSY